MEPMRKSVVRWPGFPIVANPALSLRLPLPVACGSAGVDEHATEPG
jgi:hypothetical protein